MNIHKGLLCPFCARGDHFRATSPNRPTLVIVPESYHSSLRNVMQEETEAGGARIGLYPARYR